MPNIAPRVNATGLPSRRAALATFTGTAAALGLLSVGAAASSAPATDPDAGLLALAARTLVLNDLFDAIDAREAELDDLLMLHGPRRPPAPVVSSEPAPVVDHRQDGSFTLHMPAPSRSEAESTAAEKSHEAALAIFNAEREAYAHRIGLRAAESARRRADRRLKAAVEALTAMPAVTLKGIIAKARVSAAADPDDAYVLFTALRASVLRDLIAIGGAA